MRFSGGGQVSDYRKSATLSDRMELDPGGECPRVHGKNMPVVLLNSGMSETANLGHRSTFLRSALVPPGRRFTKRILTRWLVAPNSNRDSPLANRPTPVWWYLDRWPDVRSLRKAILTGYC